MEKINFHLSSTYFMDQGIDIEFHLLAVIVNFFKQRVELIDRVDAVGLARGLGAATAANRRFEQSIGVGVACSQVKL